MKVFWSWQSDTPGEEGRFFVRDALADAIKKLKQTEDIDEPLERETREALHLDHDRKGISGTPPIADVIFEKIRLTNVFIADVTAVGSLVRLKPSSHESPEKKLINPNVAIEYGYAVAKVGDEMILLVHNTHYGDLSDLPFDLKHKGKPIEYCLPPESSKSVLNAEKVKLVGKLVVALRECLVTLAKRVPTAPAAPKFKATEPRTGNRAFFWQPGEVLAKYGDNSPISSILRGKEDDVYQYTFEEPRALYVRLIPTVASPMEFKFGDLYRIVELRRLRVMTRTIGGNMPFRNKYGAITYESSGVNLVPTAFTQLLKNGEIWGVTREFWTPYNGEDVVVMGDVENRIREGLGNFVAVACDELKLEPPFNVEIGMIGLLGMRMALPQQPNRNPYANSLSDVIQDGEEYVGGTLKDRNPSFQASIIREFMRKAYALVAVDYD